MSKTKDFIWCDYCDELNFHALDPYNCIMKSITYGVLEIKFKCKSCGKENTRILNFDPES